jgi:anthranilate phosphoribosyltransferase
MIKEAIEKFVRFIDLNEKEMIEVMKEITEGIATPSQISSFITALRMKGETIPEITGAAKVMREKGLNIRLIDDNLIDTCGTGGDGANTFNISTVSAFVIAGAGLPVAKHGNRALSSRCGSADLLKALGVKIDMDKDLIEKCIDEIGIGFLYAPIMHKSMKYATPVRREIGIRTVFNILGPLTNPANVKFQLVGIYDADLTEKIAHVLNNLGCKKAFVVHGEDGLDEITISGKTFVSEVKDGEVRSFAISPEDFGLKRYPIESILGGSPEYNREIAIKILKGKALGPFEDVVLLNSSAALFIGGVADDLLEGVEIARDSIKTGKAYQKLMDLIDLSNS